MPEATKEPGMGWGRTIHVEPELRMEGEKFVTGGDIISHDWSQVGGVNNLGDVNTVTLKNGVGFVCWQQEFEFAAEPLD